MLSKDQVQLAASNQQAFGFGGAAAESHRSAPPPPVNMLRVEVYFTARNIDKTPSKRHKLKQILF